MDFRFSSKQAFLFTFINYLGVLIGVFSTLFIYPKDTEMLGIVRYIDGYAQIFYPIMVLGASTALLNFYPLLNTILQRKLFTYSILSVFLMIIFTGIGVVILGYSDVFERFRYVIIAFFIAICLAFVDLIKRQLTNMQKIAVPTLYEKIIPKVALPLAFILVLYFSYSLDGALLFYTLTFVCMLLLVVIYLLQYYRPVYTLQFKDLFQIISKKNYYQYSLYAFTASIGSFFAFRVDSFMIPEITGDFELNGIFNIGVTLANAIMIPAIGVFALYSPVISNNIKNGEFDLLKKKYSEVAKNLFFVGILLYGCVILGIHDLFKILPAYDNLVQSLPVIYILGASVLLNMSTGFNTEIIAFSSYYRFNLVSIIVLMFLNVGLNWYILKYTGYGIIGVAFASFFSMAIFNIMKLYFIYKKFKMIPFSTSYLKVVLISVTLLTVLYYIPSLSSPLFTMLLKCSLYVILLLTVLYITRLIIPLNDFVKKITNNRD